MAHQAHLRGRPRELSGARSPTADCPVQSVTEAPVSEELRLPSGRPSVVGAVGSGARSEDPTMNAIPKPDLQDAVVVNADHDRRIEDLADALGAILKVAARLEPDLRQSARDAADLLRAVSRAARTLERLPREP